MTLLLDDLWFSYGSKPVLRGLTLHAGPGEIVGVLGANGSGKTTTFHLLSGLLRPDGGEMSIGSASVLAEPREAKRRLGFVPDEPLHYPTLSALENLNMFGLLWGVSPAAAKARAEALLREVGLWSVRHQWARSYSRGMQQKLALCAALLHEPELIVLDEPFTGLDIDAVLWARELLARLAAEGRCIVFSSHLPETVDVLATRVAVLAEGRIVCDEPREVVAAGGGVEAMYRRVASRSGSDSAAAS